jgi:uncharacterized protein YkwD
MKFLVSVLLVISVLSGAFAQTTPTPPGTDAELALRVLKAMNVARVENGLPPYAFNPLLAQSAQGHSEFMRETGEIVHEGPGDLTPIERVAMTGYPYLRVGENIYAGISGPEKAVEWWLTADEAHRKNVLHDELREVGIGAATNADGVTYYTIDVAAQPNVLPVFINSNEDTTRYRDVVLTLTNEKLVFGGTGRIGLATQVMISNTADFANVSAQSWQQYVNWSLDTSGGVGAKTVYVRYIDAAGQTADAQDSIVYDPRGSSAAATPSATATQTATLTPTVTSSPTASDLPPSATATDMPPTVATASPTAPEAAEVPTGIAIATEPVIPETGDNSGAMPDAQYLRVLYAGLLVAGILVIIIGVLALMRGIGTH